MLIKIEDKQEMPDDFFLYAQNDETLTMYGFTLDPNFDTYEVSEIDPDAAQKCLPPSCGKYMTLSEIVTILESMRETAISELEEEIVKLRKHISNDRFPFMAPDGKKYYVMCGEGEHRDLIKGARRKAERDPSWNYVWSMFDADDNQHIVTMPNANLIEIANAWEDWGAMIFGHAEQMKFQLQTLRYEQLKIFDVDFTMLTV